MLDARFPNWGLTGPVGSGVAWCGVHAWRLAGESRAERTGEVSGVARLLLQVAAWGRNIVGAKLIEMPAVGVDLQKVDPIECVLTGKLAQSGGRHGKRRSGRAVRRRRKPGEPGRRLVEGHAPGARIADHCMV